MPTKTIGSRLLRKYLPKDIIRISVVSKPQSNDVAAYLVVKLVQSFECPDQMLSGQVKAECATMNREVA